MHIKPLTPSLLLAAAMTLPALGQDAAAQDPAAPAENAPADRADNAPTVCANVAVMDAQGNVVQLEHPGELRWVDGHNPGVRIAAMEVPAVELIEHEDGEIRVFLRQLGRPDVVPQAPVNPPMVEATYLGLNCEPLDFDTAALLLVDEGTGLDVTFVAAGSPADEAGLEVGDTLLKMGDQVLVNPEQLAVLIRTHEAGEAVTLHVLREGEEFDLTAELGTHTVPQLGPGGRNLKQLWNVERQGTAGQPNLFRVLPENLEGHIARLDPQGGEIEQQVERIQRLLAQQLQGLPDVAQLRRQTEQMRERMQLHQIELQRMFEELDIAPGEFNRVPNFEFNMEGAGNAAMQMVWSDGEHTIQITGDAQGQQTLNVKDAQGNELFDGPMPEDNALDELPQGVGDKVREMTQGRHFQFDLNADPQAEEAPAASEEETPAGQF